MPLLYENKSDADIQLMKDWAEVRQYVEKHFENKPDIQVCLFLIGLNEFGTIREFEKEEKQDLDGASRRRNPRQRGNQAQSLGQLPQCLRHHRPDARPPRHTLLQHFAAWLVLPQLKFQRYSISRHCALRK